MSTNVDGWFGTLGVHAAVFAGTALLFGCLRRHSLFRRFYAAKRYATSKRRKPTKLPQGFCSWMLPLFKYTDTDIAEIAGVDALTYLRLQWMGVELFAFITFLGVVAVIPTNFSGGVIDDSQIPPPSMHPPPPPSPPPPPYPPLPAAPGLRCERMPDSGLDQPITGTLDKITMSNIPIGSNKLWVHLLCCVAIVFYTLQYAHSVCRPFPTPSPSSFGSTTANSSMLGSEPLLPLQILVQDVPGLQSGSVLDSLLRLVQGPLRCVTPTRYSRKLEEKVAERFRVGSGLKIPRTKKARLAKEGLLAGSSSLSLDTYKSISDEFHTPATSVSGSQRSIKFEGGFEAQKSVERPVGTSQDKGKRAVDLPQVVVTLDGQEIHHKDENVKDSIASFQFEESDEDTGHAAVAHVNLQDLDKLEKSLKAWPEAQEYLKDHSVEELVLKYFQDIYGDDVACVNVIPSQAALFPLINSYKATSQALEDLLNEYSYAIKRKLKLKIKAIRVFGPVYGAWGTKRFGKKSAKVEAIVFYMARLAELNNQIAMGQAQADASAEPSAFVTFRSRVAQTTASTALQDHDTGAWTVSPAPGPKEIIWSNVGMRSWFRGLRSLAVDASYLLLVLFYGAPVTIAQAWLTSTVLPITPDIFKSLIPGLVLKLFLAILPSILGFFALIRGAQSQSRIQWEMVERYFPFMVIVVFIFQLFGQLASDMVALGNIIVNNPTIIFSLIASYAPRQAWFFTSYVLVLGLSGRAIQFLNPVPLVLFWLKSSTAVTSAAKARVLNSIFFVYGAQIPYDTMNILLGLVFAVQNPMLPLVVLIAFLTGTFVFRYNLLYVYSEQFQSGGAVWPTVVNQILTGLVIFQIFMVGMFTLYNQPPCALIMFLTLLFTAGYWVVLTKAFNRPQRVMSMKAAAEMDRKNGVLEISSETLQRVYQPVVMRDNDAVHRDLMQQAQQILNKISADKGYQSLKALKEVPVPDDTCDAASPSSSQVAGQYSPLHDPTAAEAASLAQPSLPVSSNLRPTDTAE